MSSYKPLNKINTFNFYLTIICITQLATSYYYIITIRINEVIKFLLAHIFVSAQNGRIGGKAELTVG